jgi:predicted transcriptional regulator
MAVFSTIYQLEEQDSSKTTYKQIANNLHLSESSIRDYVQRMINKGIPIKKQKINNRKVILSIPNTLKKIATLSTIIQLRDL